MDSGEGGERDESITIDSDYDGDGNEEQQHTIMNKFQRIQMLTFRS